MSLLQKYTSTYLGPAMEDAGVMLSDAVPEGVR